MPEDAQISVSFVPSRVEGLPDVTEVNISPSGILLLAEGNREEFQFLDFAQWHGKFGWLNRLLTRMGFGVCGRPFVGERDWFHPPADRFIRFFTDPQITIYMPDEPRDVPYGSTIFRRVQEVMARGGFNTWDLG